MNSKKTYTIALTVIITAFLSFMTSSAFYNGKLLIKPGGNSRMNSVISVLDEYYYEDYNKEKAYNAALEGYVSSLGDPYTEYMTQKELAERTGIRQGDISKLEHGNGNPSLRTLQRLAAGMGMQLHLSFTPVDQVQI